MNDGGPAFPGREYNSRPYSMGMTLRDYFAGQALVGSIITAMMAIDHGVCDAFDHDRIARGAWAQADAMLKARGE